MTKKRLRKLVADNSTSDNAISSKLIAFRTIGICLLIATAIGLVTTYPHAVQDFVRSYREQYHLMVYGTSNYCTRFFNFKELLAIIRDNIYGQETALDRIETIFRGHENLTSIAIVGTTGVGKTHFVNLLRSYYPWKDNVHHYVWSTYNERDTEKYQIVNTFFGKLSVCGHNLILIDNLLPKDREFVLEYHSFMEKSLANNGSSIKLIVVYVFNVPRYTENSKTEFAKNLESLQNLKNITTVNFVQLTDLDVEQCVKKTANDLNVRLTKRHINDILQSIDSVQVGCKNVHAKITKYSDLLR